MFSQNFWRRRAAAHYALLPFSWIFATLSAIRRWCYTSGIFSATKISAPVIVIGNIVIGGGGKTPLVIAIVQALQARGFRPGIAARGRANAAPLMLTAKTDWQQCGDEPLLIYHRTAAPVCVCKNRARAAQQLQKIGCDIIICDDGLQHYALARDVEICAINASFGLGNGFLLPAGPLRENSWRLSNCDGIAICDTPHNNLELSAVLEKSNTPFYNCPLIFDGFFPLSHSTNVTEVTDAINATDVTSTTKKTESLSPADFEGKTVAALAGIAEPTRFFQLLRNNGIIPHSEHPLPDHAKMPDAAYNKIAANTDAILMTEKDAVKYPPQKNAYYARISLTPPPELIEFLVNKLQQKKSAQKK